MSRVAVLAKSGAGSGGPILERGAMNLETLLRGVERTSQIGPANPDFRQLAYDSRKLQPGALFFALRGEKADGNQFVGPALAAGARGFVSELPAPAGLSDEISWISVGNARRALAVAAANFFGHPADALRLVGVTGTNGKTTITYLLESILHAAGIEACRLGTIAYTTPRGTRPAPNTTPESLDLQELLAETRDSGGRAAVFEVSSHALSMDRVWGCRFDVAVFTNLTREHMDFHQTFENYFAAKRRLFEGTGGDAPKCAVVNLDDPYGKQLLGLAGRTLTYGLADAADLKTRKFQLSFEGLEFVADTPAGEVPVRSRLVGRINVYNILAAMGAALALEIPLDRIVAGIERLPAVPGRFERIDEGQPFLLIVDFAHTDDAIASLVATARELNPRGRILTLFGAGGEKDRTKRPLMGEAAGRGSDLVVLTNDNPRQEDPLRIINDVVVGLQKVQANYRVEPDREAAIGLILNEAQPGDMVLLAGKGHEQYQILADRTLDWDDREVARLALRRRGYGKRGG